MEYGGKKTIMTSFNCQIQSDSKVFYNNAWKHWESMIKYSPAPRMRRNKIISWLLSILPKTILDVGCGNGEFLMDVYRLMPNAKLSGADVSASMMKSNRINFPNIEFLEIDLNKETLPVKFDAVICMEVIEHCNDYMAVLKRLAAMTGKWLLITVPCGPVFEIDRRVGHKRHFKPKEITEALKSEGLHVIKLEDWGFPFFNLYKHLINLFPDKMCASFLSEQKYNFRQKMLARATYAAFNLCLPKWGFQLFMMASR